MEVTILGLFSPDVEISEFKGEIWTLTDWYRPYPWLSKIDRLFEVHTLKEVHDLAKVGDRYPGDFKEHYNSCGGTIVVDDEAWVDFLDVNVELLNYDSLKKRHQIDCKSSIDVMLIDALEHGADKIHIEGVLMIGDSHEKYIQSMLKTINYIRGEGIDVITKHEDLWNNVKCDVECEDYIKISRNYKTEPVNA